MAHEPTNAGAAPGELELIRAFVNTWDLEDEEEQLGSPAALAGWLSGHDLPSGRLDDTDLARALAVREALRAVLLANTEGAAPDPAAPATLDSAGAAAPLRVSFDAAGAAALRPVGAGVDAALGRLLAIVERAQAQGTWPRMKACPWHTCHWAFYDHSRNRSRTWCDMSVCGNRAKARAYRRRRA